MMYFVAIFSCVGFGIPILFSLYWQLADKFFTASQPSTFLLKLQLLFWPSSIFMMGTAGASTFDSKIERQVMDTNDFVKVFDVSNSGFKDWSFSAFGLVFIVIGLLMFFFPKIVDAMGIPNLNFQSKWQKFFRYYFLGFSILWTATSFYSTYTRYQRHQRLIQENGCRVVEGPVENFVPMPYTGHAEESFSVAGVRFAYSDYVVTDGFNNTASHGGPINKDSYVKICYDPLENQILRLEIRNFKGLIKNYSENERLFPSSEDLKEVGGKNLFDKLPWYRNLFIIFYLLDFIALLSLFTPYLNTFFRVKGSPITDCKIPSSIERGKKVRLRNSVLYWEKGTRSIWLRPRGLNLFQVQLVAGKLIVDEGGQSIVNKEICFSSGFPFIMFLFLWTAYQFFSITIPRNSMSLMPVQFISIAAVFFTAVVFINIKIMISRMEKLIQDALDEIKSSSSL